MATTISEQGHTNLKTAFGLYDLASKQIDRGDLEDAVETAKEADEFFFAVKGFGNEMIDLYNSVHAVHCQMRVVLRELGL